jgi:hypothetical protein
MTITKWTIITINNKKQQDLYYHVARFKEKGCLLIWGEDALSITFYNFNYDQSCGKVHFQGHYGWMIVVIQ